MSLLDEILFSVKPTENIRLVCAILLTVTSVLGFIFNLIVLLAILFHVKKKDGFIKICFLKSVGNGIVCIGYLVWPVPVTFLNYYFLPHMFNAFMGQLVGWFAWSIGPLSQVLLTSNRVVAVFFPHLYHRSYRFPPSNIGIIFCLILAFIMFAAFFPEDCHYLYNLEKIGWLPEESFCTTVRRIIFLISMGIIVIFTTACGFLLFIKLMADLQSRTMTDAQTANRRSKHQKMLIQTLVQNTLILTDTLNTTVSYKLFSYLFFQFLTLSFSMVFIRAIEGVIMITMNERIRSGAKALFIKKSNELSKINVGQTMLVWNASTTTMHK